MIGLREELSTMLYGKQVFFNNADVEELLEWLTDGINDEICELTGRETIFTEE